MNSGCFSHIGPNYSRRVVQHNSRSVFIYLFYSTSLHKKENSDFASTVGDLRPFEFAGPLWHHLLWYEPWPIGWQCVLKKRCGIMSSDYTHSHPHIFPPGDSIRGNLEFSVLPKDTSTNHQPTNHWASGGWATTTYCYSSFIFTVAEISVFSEIVARVWTGRAS